MSNEKSGNHLAGHSVKTIAAAPLLVSTAFLFVAAAGIIFFEHLGSLESYAHRALREKTKNMADLMSSKIAQSLRAHDDVTLLNYLGELAAAPDCVHARVVGADGTIMADGRIELWGRNLSDGKIAAALATLDKPLFFGRTDPPGYDYVSPLEGITPPAFLIVGASSQKAQLLIESARLKAVYILAGVVFAGAVCFYLTINLFVVSRLKKMHKNLESVLLGSASERVPVKANDEIDALGAALNAILDKISKGASERQSDRGSLEHVLSGFVGEIASGVESGVAALDSSDNIIHVNPAACDILGISRKDAVSLRGRHIVDAVKSAAVLEVLKESAVSPGAAVEKSAEEIGARVRAVAVDDGRGRLGGTILFFERVV